MATLLCYEFPAFRIFNPDNGEVTSFQNGKLEIEEDDPNFGAVMAEASRNPAIVILVSAYTCMYCGADQPSDQSLAAHVKEVHYDKWVAADDADFATKRLIEVKSRAGVNCDVCQPIQTFGTQQDLALHMRLVHAGAPEMDAEGNTAEEGPARGRRRRPGEVDSIPAASER